MMKAGLMAREYGILPTEVLGETHLPKGTQFHLDFDIYQATATRIQEIREEKREQANPGSSRVAGPRERNQMINSQEQRAKQRNQMQQAGMKAPSPEGQLSQLDEIMQERAEAKQMGEPDRVNQDG